MYFTISTYFLSECGLVAAYQNFFQNQPTPPLQRTTFLCLSLVPSTTIDTTLGRKKSTTNYPLNLPLLSPFFRLVELCGAMGSYVPRFFNRDGTSPVQELSTVAFGKAARQCSFPLVSLLNAGRQRRQPNETPRIHTTKTRLYNIIAQLRRGEVLSLNNTPPTTTLTINKRQRQRYLYQP